MPAKCLCGVVDQTTMRIRGLPGPVTSRSKSGASTTLQGAAAHSTSTRSSILIGLLSALVFLPWAAIAQNPRGTLRGVVEDSTGARVASAKISLNTTGFSARETTSDQSGEFRIEDLQPGLYHIQAAAPGFADARAEVKITISSVAAVTVRLKPATVQQNITVEGQGSSITTQPIDTSSTVQQAIVTAQDLETVPLAHRSFANIAYMAPGTEPVEPSDPTKARITAVSFGGSSGLNVDLSVDGGDNNDDFIGGFLQNYSPDSMQEF